MAHCGFRLPGECVPGPALHRRFAFRVLRLLRDSLLSTSQALFSTASGVAGLVAGPSSDPFCGSAEVLSEAFQLAWAGGCATGLRTRCRHGCNVSPASTPTSPRSAAAFNGALARSHGSRLLSLRSPFVHRPAVSFVPSPASEDFHGSCRDRVSFPGQALTLFRLSAFFVWRTLSRGPPEPPARADTQ
jgi:hypothetical protein